MSLSGLTTSLVSSELGFFPNVSNYDLKHIEYRMKLHSSGLFPGPPSYHWPTLGLDLPPEDKFGKVRDKLHTRFMNEKPKYPTPINIQPQLTSTSKDKPRLPQGMLLDNAYQMFPPDLWRKIHNSKYIMVCCFFVPMLTDDGVGLDTMNFISVASELRELYGSDFELVLVAKMRRGWLNHKPSFDHFFSGFPPFCKVIPFSDVNTRDHICQLLGFDYSDPVFLLLERQTSSANYKVLNDGGIYCFEDRGAEDFPFTDHLEWFDQYPSQLDRILGRKPSEIRVSRASGGGESVSLSELEGKLVCLYLCSEGSLMLGLDQVSRECKERGLEFEVVLVYMPFHCKCNVNTLMESINNHMLSNMSNARSWWIMPYIDSISRRLWRMTPSFNYFEEDDRDKLIIVGPNGKYVNQYAGAFLGKYGVDVYPFTCERLIEWKMEKVRSATLESLLVHGSRDFVLGKDDNNNNGSGGFIKKVPVKQLNGKVVLVCFYYYHTEGPHRAAKAVAYLLKYYDEIKSRHPNFEVVSVSLGSSDPYDEFDYNIGTPPWLVCPPEPDHSKCVYDKLGIDEPTIVAFGEDGRVSSVTVEDDLLSEMGVDAFPFKGGDLRREVTRALTMENANGNWNIPGLTTQWSPRGDARNKEQEV